MTVGFSRPKKWKPIAELIMLLEGTDYSHVFVTWRCTNIQRRKVFESVGSGSRILSNITFKKHAHVHSLYHFEVDDATLFKIEQATHDQSGRPYGYKALLGLGFMRCMNFFNRLLGLKGRQNNPFKDGDYSQVCVESAAMVLKYARPDIYFGEIENYGLKEMKTLVEKYGQKVPEDKIARINKG